MRTAQPSALNAPLPPVTASPAALVPDGDEHRLRHDRRLVGAERAELVVAAGVERAVGRPNERAVPAGRHVRDTFTSAGSVSTRAGTDRFVVVPSQSCDRSLLPHTHTRPSARTAALCHVPAANDDHVGQVGHGRLTVHRPAVAELSVAAAAEGVEPCRRVGSTSV